MRIYWYWPWPAHRGLHLAAGTVAPGDHLTLHALDDSTEARPAGAGSPGVRIIADLPPPRPAREWSPRWIVDRNLLLWRRTAQRQELVSSLGFDVCHVQLLHYFVDAWMLRRLRRMVPLVSTVHDVYPHHSRLPTRLERRLLSAVYRSAGVIVVYHDHLGRRLREDFRVEPERIRVIPHPIRAFRGHDPEVSDPPRVLFFGTFRRNKGIPVLLEAIERLRRSDIRFVFAGRGVPELEAAVRDAARRDQRITAHIRYITDEERDDLYADADLVVLPYTAFASQSGVLADAYSYGVPLLTTDVGALGETVREEGTGWVVPPGDAASLAGSIETALSDAPRRRGIVAAMSALAEARSESATGRRFRALYEEVVGDGSTPP